MKIHRLWIFFVVLCLCGCTATKKEETYPSTYIDSNGNEFIWVPIEQLQRYDFSNETYVEAREPIERIYYGEEREESILYGTEYPIDSFLQSVEKTKGFYISKYLISEQLESKPEQNPMTMVTRDEALELAQSFQCEDSFVATLPNSYAYDALFLYLRNTEETLLEDRGKLLEWSTEFSSNGYYDDIADCVMRDTSKEKFASREYNGNLANPLVGFRVLLYVKG